MLGVLPVGDPVLRQHVPRKVELRFEAVAGRAPHGGHLPRLGGLALGNMPQIGEDVALLAVSTHASVLGHLPLAREETATVRTIMLKIMNLVNTTAT